MDDMAAQAGIASFSSDHIYLGQSLNTIWNNPTHTDSPYGTSPGVTTWPNSAGNFPTAVSTPACLECNHHGTVLFAALWIDR